MFYLVTKQLSEFLLSAPFLSWVIHSCPWATAHYSLIDLDTTIDLSWVKNTCSPQTFFFFFFKSWTAFLVFYGCSTTTRAQGTPASKKGSLSKLFHQRKRILKLDPVMTELSTSNIDSRIWKHLCSCTIRTKQKVILSNDRRDQNPPTLPHYNRYH